MIQSFSSQVSKLLVLVIFFSCNRSQEVGPDSIGYDFYPIEMGAYHIYDVREIHYLITGFDTAHYQIKETIIDSIRSQDRITYLLRREVRLSETDEWESDSIYTVIPTENYLAITENNVPFMKLTFPVKEGKAWNGNSLNGREAITYYYQAVDSLYIDSLNLDDHIRLVIEDIEENITGVDLRSEVYVRGIGLVAKEYLTQKKCTASDCGSDLGKVIAGRSLQQTLIEIGNE